jgi:hypothetical protein
VDYVKFSASAGEVYVIETSLPSHGDTEIWLEATLTIENETGLVPIRSDDDSGSGKASKIVWEAPDSDTYYVMILDSIFSLAEKPYFYEISVSEAGPLSKKLEVPLIGQETDAACWAASSQMVLEFYGVKVSQKEIAHQVGSEYYYTFGLVPGLELFDNWRTTLENLSGMSFDFKDLSWKGVMSEIDDNEPIIDLLPYHTWVITGYNDQPGYENDEVFINDPWPPTTGSTPGGRQTVKRWGEISGKVASYTKHGYYWSWDSMCVGGGGAVSASKGDQDDAGTGSDAGDNFLHATTIVPGEYLGHLVEGIDHRDFYKFDAGTGQEIRVTLNPPFDSDLDLMLFDPDGNIKVGSYKALPGHPENVTFVADSSGYWTIGVYWISDNFGTYSFGLYLMGAPEEELPEYKVFGWVKSEGVPVANAQVMLDGQSTATDEGGYYEFTGLEGNRSYSIEVRAEGYESYSETVYVGTADNQLDVSLVKAEVAPAPTYKVFGWVKSEGVPVANAQVVLDGQPTTTDENGYYEFTGLEGNRSYELTVSAEGYEAYSETVSVGAADVQCDISLTKVVAGVDISSIAIAMIVICCVIGGLIIFAKKRSRK